MAGAVVVIGLLFAGQSLGMRLLLVGTWSVPLLGLFLLVAGSWLTYRRADPGSWLLMAWGALLLVNTVLSLTMNLRGPVSAADIKRIQALASVWSAIYWLFMWGTAVYVVWRLRPRRVT